jgi:hypothetical protein
MNNERKTKQAGPEGRRRLRRPGKEWGQYIGEIATDRGMKLKSLKKIAQDRDQYMKWINGSIPNGNRRR